MYYRLMATGEPWAIICDTQHCRNKLESSSPNNLRILIQALGWQQLPKGGEFCPDCAKKMWGSSTGKKAKPRKNGKLPKLASA